MMPDQRLILLSDSVSAMQRASDRPALAAALEAGLLPLGPTRFALSVNARTEPELVCQPLLSNASPDFMKALSNSPARGAMKPLSFRAFHATTPFSAVIDREAEPGSEAMSGQPPGPPPLAAGYCVVVPLPHLPDHASCVWACAARPPENEVALIACLRVLGGVAMMRAYALGLCADRAKGADFGLTVQQLEILNWAAQGKSNGDIAAILGQTRRAIDYHMAEILRKLGVASRAQAIVRITEAEG